MLGPSSCLQGEIVRFKILVSCLGLCLTGIALSQESQSGAFQIYLRLKEAADRQEALALAAAYGLPLRRVLPDGTIMELARFRNGKPMYWITDNANAAITTRASRVYAGGGAGLSLNGSGIVLGEWDGGSARTTHTEFGGRVTVMDGAGAAGHATHVAGTMIASGVDAPSKGMSFAATLRSWDWNSDSSEMDAAATAGSIMASNHSYGYVTGWAGGSPWYWYGDRVAGHTEDAGFGFYDDSARDWDQIMWDHKFYLVVKSAGNDRNEGPSSQPVNHKEWNGSAWIDVTDVRTLDGGPSGYDSISYSSCFKNGLTVGAVNDVASYTGPASVVMSSFSCWGPTDDGRIKPDIVANGVALKSTYSSSDTSYAVMSGTSMATPNACGSLGLIAQHYKTVSGISSTPESAFLKGLVIHTADECGSSPGPDYSFGWGLMNVEAACALLTNNYDPGSPVRWRRAAWGSIKAGQTLDYRMTRIAASPIKVTVCWTDAPGTPPAWSVDPTTPMLKNNIDLRIVGPDGTIYYPWKLNPASPSSAATRADNNVDNVEQVVIDAPMEGTYRVQVTVDGSLTGTTDQPFNIFIDNLQSQNQALSYVSVSPNAVTGGAPSTGTVNMNFGGWFPANVGISDNSTFVTTAPNAYVLQGQKTANFAIATSAVTSMNYTTITASFIGVTKTASLIVMPPFALNAIRLTRSIIVAGETPLAATVYMTALAPSPTAVTLSDNSANLTTPPSVTIPTNRQIASFSFASSAIGAPTLVTVSAVYSGVTKTANVTLEPPPVLTSLTLGTSGVHGGTPLSATVNLSLPAPTGGDVVTTSDDSANVTTPASVTVSGGSLARVFTITTSAVASTSTVTVSAVYRGVTKTKTFLLMP